MYNVNDKFAHRARKEGYRARSAYKLLDIQKKFRILKPGIFVLDIGAAPGSWMQVTSKIIGKSGKILGIDQEPIAPLNGSAQVKTLEENIFSQDLVERVQEYFGGKVDVALSDAAPATTGMRERDQALSYDLAERAIEIAISILKKGGDAVIKIFESKDTPFLLARARKYFEFVKTFKPVGSQKRSKETYIIAKNYLQDK